MTGRPRHANEITFKKGGRVSFPASPKVERKIALGRAKVAIIHPQLGFGGSESAVLWTIEALKHDYDVTFISMGNVNLEQLNAYYETALAPGDFHIQRAPLPWGLRNTAKFAGLKSRFFLRHIHRVASDFDVMISMYGPMDFGKPGIQRIADFSFVEEWRLELHPTFRTWKAWFYGDTLVRHAYLQLCNFIAASDPQAWKKNTTVVNSAWSADRLLQKYGIPSKVLYCPVPGNYPAVPCSARDKGFVFMGRVSPEKCVDSAIEILHKVRERGHDVHLHVLGGVDNSEYAKKVQNLANRYNDWVFLEGKTLGARKKELLTSHRFGINACPNEAFGIAVAEMVLAGCVVFVPNGGGQVELIKHPALIFANEAEAVEKIDAILTHETEQEELRAQVLAGSKAYSVDTFMQAMRNVVAEFLAPGISRAA